MIVSVIIPTCNRNDLLGKCLDLLAPDTQKKGAREYELIVTDDSKDNTAKGLIEQQYPWAKWTQGPKRGPAANRNYGAKQALGEWLIFIDDDCLPVTDIIYQYQKAINDYPQAGAFEGAILPNDERLVKKDMAECPVNKEGGYFWTANVCIRKTCFEKVNGFDEDFILAAHEDQILYLRLKEITTVVFIPGIKVVHPVRFIPLRTKIKNDSKKLKNWLIYTQKRKLPFSIAIKEALHGQLRELVHHILQLKPGNAALNVYTLFISLPALIIRQTMSIKKREHSSIAGNDLQATEKPSTHL
jgi:GT2 family glycosyltransferase